MMEVRPALERDFPAIARIQQQVPEAAQWPLGDYTGTPLLLALVDSRPSGFCAWRQTAPDEAELLNLAVDPSLRRRGVATALLNELALRATGDIYLEVAEPNAHAIALYQKAGFKAVATRKGYYQNGRIDAVVMKKTS